MAEKVITIMVLKVDLQCTKCYKKVKKLLCKYPQIRDQEYNEKANTVTITVVCCNPQKIRDKLCCKGRGTIKSIDIKEPEKKKEPEKPKPVPEKPKSEPEKPKDKPKPVVVVVPPKPDPPKPPATAPAPKAPEPAPKAPAPVPVAAYPLYPTYGVCCVPCYIGQPGGPCYSGHGTPMRPPPCNCGCGGHGMPTPPPPCNCGCSGGGGRSTCYDGYGQGYTVNRCYYVSEENPSACTVM